MLGDLATGKTTETGNAEQVALARGVHPPNDRHPALPRGATDGRAGAHPAPDRASGLAAGVGRDRNGDRPGAVPTAAKQAVGAHLQDRFAGAAAVTPHLHDEALRPTGHLHRPADLPLDDAMPHDDQPRPHRSRRRAAARAAPRPRLGTRRRPRHPGLDPQRARDEPPAASCLLDGVRSATGRGAAAQCSALSVAFPLLRPPALQAPHPDGHHARLAGRPGGAPPATASPPTPSRRGPPRGRG